MLNAILGLFTAFNPIIVGMMLMAGAYIALRHRVLPSLDGVRVRAGHALSRASSGARALLAG